MGQIRVSFETSDGYIFYEEWQAKAHQEYVNKQSTLEQIYNTCSELCNDYGEALTYRRLESWLLENYDFVQELYEILYNKDKE